MNRNYSSDENPRVKLNYGEIYSFFIDGKEEKGVYIGSNLKGMGRIVSRRGKSPVIRSFNLKATILENKLLKGKFSFIFLNDKEESFAIEILNKKSL